MSFKSLKGILLTILFLAIIYFAFPVQAQEGVITPSSLSLELEQGSCTVETINVTTPSVTAPKLDVAFLFDITGSMEGLIDSATSGANTIMTNVRTLVPDSNFAVGTFGDYDDPYAWQQDADITASNGVIQTALDNIVTGGGGDFEEAYLRALYESQNFSWREDARRIVIIFGDSIAHDPDAGVDGVLGTSDDLRQDNILRDIRNSNITVIGVYTESEVAFFYEEISEATGGLSFFLAETSEIAEVVGTLLGEAIRNTEGLTISDTAPEGSWVSLSPELYTGVPPSTTNSFEVTFCVPDDADGGDYTFDLNAKADGFTIGVIPVSIYVPLADISITQINVEDSVDFGEEVVYSLAILNDGPDATTQVIVRDVLPEHVNVGMVTAETAICAPIGNVIECNVGDMTVGQQERISIVVEPTMGGVVNNEATVTSTRFDPNLANNTVTGTAIAVASDLNLSHITAPTTINYAELFTYILTVVNDGPLPASDALLTGSLPAGLSGISIESDTGNCQISGNDVNCAWSTLDVGETATLSLTVEPITGGDVQGEFSIAAHEVDPDTSNNVISAATNVIATDLSVTVVDMPDPIRAQKILSYTLAVSNNGPSFANGVVVTHTVPLTVSLTTVVSPQGDCSLSGQTAVCQFNTLNSGQSVTVQVAAVPTEKGKVQSVSQVIGNEVDPSLPDNQHTEITEIRSQYSPWLGLLLLFPISLIGWFVSRRGKKSAPSQTYVRPGHRSGVTQDPKRTEKPKSDPGVSVTHGRDDKAIRPPKR
ncbi:MAG: DUF11 domain-containing protein [Chloroflexi bacterium]|nr:DUF11 domain-containing protein [Chloroflexota bacterium]